MVSTPIAILLKNNFQNPLTNHQEYDRIKMFPSDGAAYLLAVKWNGAAHSHLGT